MFEPGSGRCGALQIQTREPIKAAEYHQTSLKKALTGNGQSNKMNITPPIALAFYRKYSDVTPFVITNVFISSCN